MSSMPHPSLHLHFHPLTPAHWPDIESLFGAHGAYGGCWCMWWRESRAEFDRNHGDGNRRAFKAIVDAGVPTGILAYDGATPAAWCSIAPRETYPSLERSRVLARVDDRPVWSLVCFYMAKAYRGRGLTAQVIQAAVDHAQANGARIVEAYPSEPKEGARLAPVSSYMGLAPAFRRLGFVEAARRSERHPVMRLYLA